MSFLSTYAGTERIDIDEHYHVVIKKYLSSDELLAAESLLITTRISEDKDGKPRVTTTQDTKAYQQELVLKAIVSWNLDGDTGELPITIATIRTLPGFVVDTVYKRVQSLSRGRTAQEGTSFRGERDGGDRAGAQPTT